MRIQFITNYHQLYGANRSLLSIIKKFKNEGHDVCLLLPRKGDYSAELERQGIPFEVIPYYSQLFYYRKSFAYMALPILDLFSVIMLPYIILKIKRFKPDLIYSNTAAENVGIIIASCMGVRHLSHIREFMDLDHRLSFLFGAKAKQRYICKSDAVLYVSKAVAKHTLGTDELPCWHKVIYNGVEQRDVTFCNRTITGKGINFGIVGLLDESKGQDMAINYFNIVKDNYPDSVLHIWGDKEGDYKKALQRQIKDLDLSNRVILHGFEKNPEVIYNQMDVLLMCSKAEGFGRVTVEAMSRGIPVLGYDSGGTAEIVRDGIDGYLFKNEEDFKSCCQKLLSSPEHYAQISFHAYQNAKNDFSEEKYVDEVYQFVDKLMTQT